jgi:uncharacterized protein (PEP-CTERM system associated)
VAWAAAALAAAPAFAPTVVHAQKWTVDSGIGAQLGWTSNGEFGTVADGRDDTILNVHPHIAVHAEGGRLKVTGTAALNAITSAQGTQPSRILPEADIDAKIEAVRQFLFVDTGARILQTSVDPFGPRPETGTNRNVLTAYEMHLTPSIESTIGSNVRYELRSENSWTRQSGAPEGSPAATSADGYFGRHTARIVHDPLPVGWHAEVERSQTRYRDDPLEPLTIDLARFSVNYALTDWTFGVRVGREHQTRVPADQQRTTLYGGEALWRPSQHTELIGFVEKRFFGNAWKLAFDQHLPRFAWSVSLERRLDTTPQTLFDLPASDNVAGLLDAMLTSRFPDPVQRAKAVQDMIAQQGLATQTLQPVTLYSQRLSVVTSRTASLVLNGVRNTLSFGIYDSRTEDVQQSQFLATGDTFSNNTQTGASVALNHRLTPNLAFNISADWSRVRSLQSDDRSTERRVRAQMSLQVTPRTNAFAALRYRHLDSTTATSGREGGALIGFDHRF